MKIGKLIILGMMSACMTSSPVWSSTSNMELAKIDIAEDQASLQRGAKIFYNECRMCHSMKYIKYRNLLEIGFDEQYVDKLRGEKLLSDRLQSINNDSTLQALFGMVPPDLSLMAKARKHGPDYIYTLMTSYHENSDGRYDNALFPNIKMPDIFNISTALSDEEKEEIKAKTKDVVAFLNWTADPRASERQTLGAYVTGYFVLLSFLYYLLMKRIWRRVESVKTN